MPSWVKTRPRQRTVVLRDFDPVYVGSGSKSVIAVMSAARPLSPHEQTFASTHRTAASCRYCCKSPKLPGANFPAVKKSDRRPPIDVASITLPGSPASFSSDDEIPHIFTWKSPVQPKEILIARAKRLLQQNPLESGHRTFASGLAALMFVDRGLDRRLRLRARRLEFGLGVGIGRVAQRVGVALEMRMNVARHELIAALGGPPIRPIMREQQNPAEPAVRALPQSLEMAHAVIRRADTGKTRCNQILGRVCRNVWRDDG